MKLATQNRWKLLLQLLLLLALCLLAFALLLPSLLNSAWFKDTLATKLTEGFDRPVKIAGDIRLSSGLTSHLSLSNFTIESPAKISKEPLLFIGDSEIALRPLPLLLGNIVIEKLVAKNVVINLVETEANEKNWVFSTQEDEEEDSEDTSLTIPTLQLVELESFKVHLKTPSSDRNLAITSFSLRTDSSDSDSLVESSFTLDNIPLTLAGKIRSIQYLLLGDSLEFSLQLQSKANKVTATGELQQNGSVKGTLASKGDNLLAIETLLGLSLPEWTGYSLSTTLAVETGAPLKIALDNLKLKLEQGSIAGFTDLSIAENGDISGKVDLNINDTKLLLNGKYRPLGKSQSTVRFSGENLATLNSFFESDLPKWNTFAFEADVTADKGIAGPITLDDFTLAVDGSDLSGTTTVQLTPLAVTAKLNSRNLDLVELTQKSSTDKENASSVQKREPRIPYESFSAFDADLTLSVEKLRTFLGLDFSDVSLNAKLLKGELSLPSLSGSAFGGSFSGMMAVGNNHLSFTLDGHNFAANPIVLLAGGDPLLEGNFDMSLQLQSTGATKNEILKSLSGTASLQTENAHLKSATLLTASSGLSNILSPVFGGKSAADVPCLLFNATIENGIAEAAEQVLKLGEVFIFADGTLNLPEDRINYHFNVNSANPSIASLVPPFRASGSLSNPTFRPSVSGSVASVFDTTQGVAGSALKLLSKTAEMFSIIEAKELHGVALCKEAYAVEQKLLSSRIGSLFKRTKKTLEPDAKK